MKCNHKNQYEHWKYMIQTFGLWFEIKLHLKLFWIFHIRNPIWSFFKKFKKKKYTENNFVYTGTNGTPTTFGSG